MPGAKQDPQVGDRVQKGTRIRTVTAVDGGNIRYVTEKGVNRSCWISTWREWCRKAEVLLPPEAEDIQMAILYTVAHLAYEGDGITALYEQDDLIMEGDYYHDKIDSKIEGFFFALDHHNIVYSRQDLYVSDEHYDVAYGPDVPAGLDELRAMYPYKTEDD